MEQSTFIAWHRILGTALAQAFAGSPFAVDTELDLSFRQQRLDILILRKLPGEYQGRLPDGLEGLVDHNLITYKSLHEPLDVWALDELLGHYVNYRKQVALPEANLLPEEAFQLYGICTRFPQNLANRVSLAQQQTGVYDVQWGARPIRVIVLSEIPAQPHNALWALFSASTEKVMYGAEQMRDRMEQMSTVLNSLLENYELEGIPMSYTIEDFEREAAAKQLQRMKPNEVLRNYSADDLLRELGPAGILRNYSADDLLRELGPAGILQNYSADDLLRELGSAGILRNYSADDLLRELGSAGILRNYSADDLLRELGSAGILRNYSADDLLREMFRGDFIRNVPIEELEAYIEQYKRDQQDNNDQTESQADS